MKNILYIILMACFTSSLVAQQDFFNTPQNIKSNNIRSVKAYEYDTVLKENGAYLSFIIDYDRNGNILEHTSYSNGDRYQTSKYIYDRYDNLLEEKVIDADSVCTSMKTYEYDNNNLLKEVHFKDDLFQKSIEYTYNENNHIITAKHTRKDSSSYILSYTYDIDSSNQILAKYINTHLKEEFLYNSFNQKIKKVDFDKNGEIRNKFIYQYYPNGSLMQISQHIPSTRTMYRWYYEYNENKQVIVEKEYKDRVINEYIYDSTGLLVQFKHYVDFSTLLNGCLYEYKKHQKRLPH